MSSLTEHAGGRNRRVTFEQLRSDAAVDEAGHVDEATETNWSPFASRWAEVHTKGSREFFRREQVASEVTHRIKILWDEELWRLLNEPNASKFRIKLESGILPRTLNISGPPVNEDEGDMYVSFPCVEVK